MTDTLFVTLYDALSRKLAHDMQCPDVVQSLRIIPDALPVKGAPVVLYEAVHKGSVVYTGYYPLNEQAYRIAFPKIGLVRFNMSNMNNGKKRIFTCGVDWLDSAGYLYATMDLPTAPEDPKTAHDDLFRFIDTLAASLKLHLLPVKLGWYKADPSQHIGG